MNEILLIIDCNYVCHVNMFAEMSHQGSPTGIIFGFLRHMLELATTFETSNFVFCWDSRKSLRKEMYPTYKGNRMSGLTEEEKVLYFTQFVSLRESVLPMIGFNNIFMEEGYEADDLIASIVMNENDKKIVVVSNDGDLFQLLDYCSLYNMLKKTSYNRISFTREYKIEPSRWAEVKAIAGCNTDNVKGVPGVGETTAIKWLLKELKPTSKKGEAISKQTKEEYNRNLRLVKLPFMGVRQFEVKADTLYLDFFLHMCDRYGLNSYKQEPKLSKFAKAFQMRG